MEEREEREEEAREALKEGEHTLVDMMGVLAGMEGNGKTLKKQEPPPENLGTSLCILLYVIKRFILVAILVIIIWDVQKIIKKENSFFNPFL